MSPTSLASTFPFNEIETKEPRRPPLDVPPGPEKREPDEGGGREARRASRPGAVREEIEAEEGEERAAHLEAPLHPEEREHDEAASEAPPRSRPRC